MIHPFARVVLSKGWKPHLKVSPAYFDFKQDDTFIFLGEIPNDPGKCIVFGEQSGNHFIGKTEFFDEFPKVEEPNVKADL